MTGPNNQSNSSEDSADSERSDEGETVTGDLFSGVEDANEPIAGTSDSDPVEESDTFSLGRALETITYRELHSFAIGLGPTFMLVIARAFSNLPMEALGGAVGMITLGTILGRSAAPEGRIRTYLLKEPHYVLIGQVIGVILGVIVLQFL